MVKFSHATPFPFLGATRLDVRPRYDVGRRTPEGKVAVGNVRTTVSECEGKERNERERPARRALMQNDRLVSKERESCCEERGRAMHVTRRARHELSGERPYCCSPLYNTSFARSLSLLSNNLMQFMSAMWRQWMPRSHRRGTRASSPSR